MSSPIGLMGMGRGLGMGGLGVGAPGMGFRSVPATGPANAVLQPGQTRHLPTRVVSLGGPSPTGQPALPAKDEPLELGEIRQLTDDPVVIEAVTRLAQEKAPETVSQLVMWNLVGGLDWRQVDRLSNRWANSAEVALARQFVARLRSSGAAPARGESGVVYVEVRTKADADDALAKDLRALLEESGLLGLNVRAPVPARPGGPALACRIALTEAGEAEVTLSMPDSRGGWARSGRFVVPVTRELLAVPDKPEPTAAERAELRAGLLADGVAEGLLARLVRAQLQKGPKVHGKDTYRIRIDNVSPLVLNGVALTGTSAPADGKGALSALAGFSVPPRKSLSLPASAEMVERLGLKANDGIKAIAADLSAP